MVRFVKHQASRHQLEIGDGADPRHVVVGTGEHPVIGGSCRADVSVVQAEDAALWETVTTPHR
jgi:hypothetical protein